ncbi:MAG: YbeD family protein [Pseudomonas sp.]
MSDTPDAPRIEFPCTYPIKVIGTAGEGFTELVIEIAERHAPGLDTTRVEVMDSKNGRFLSVRVEITATGPDQLQALHAELKATGRVHMVL